MLYIIRQYLEVILQKHFELVAEKWIRTFQYLLNQPGHNAQIYFYGWFFIYEFSGHRIEPNKKSSAIYFCAVYRRRVIKYTNYYSLFQVILKEKSYGYRKQGK